MVFRLFYAALSSCFLIPHLGNIAIAHSFLPQRMKQFDKARILTIFGARNSPYRPIRRIYLMLNN